MRYALALLVFLLMSCQEQDDSTIASDVEQNSDETIEQFYFAAFHLQPVLADDSAESQEEEASETSAEESDDDESGTEQMVTEEVAIEPIKVAIKVSVKDNKPHSLMIKDITSGEVPADSDDSKMLLLTMPTELTKRIGHQGSRKYLASDEIGDEHYELHWFNGTWKQYRKLGATQERGPISDTSVARFVVRIGELEYANVDDSEDSDISFDNRLKLSAEEIIEKYFASEENDADADLLAHRAHENFSELCNQDDGSLEPHIGYNVYRIERTSCQNDDEPAGDGALLVRASVGVASHLAGISSGSKIMCLIDSAEGGLFFHSGDDKLLLSTDCSKQLVDIQAYDIDLFGSFLKISVKTRKGEEEVVWLKGNEVSSDSAYGEALRQKHQKDAEDEMGESETTTDLPPKQIDGDETEK